jgi:hypothetical protein
LRLNDVDMNCVGCTPGLWRHSEDQADRYNTLDYLDGTGPICRALSNVTNCLPVPALASADLDSGEPAFRLAGTKSYGRARTILLKNGYAQTEMILHRLNG